MIILNNLKTASNWAIQKKAKTTSNFIGNKFAGKIARTKLQIADTALQTDKKINKITKRKITITKKRQRIIDELKLI